jgi:hypothetical protein
MGWVKEVCLKQTFTHSVYWIKLNKIMEKYNFQPNPENRFKVVRYFPTLEMIKKDLLNMQNNNWGYCDVLKRIIEEDFEGEDLNMLVKKDIATINILNLLTKNSYTNFNQHYGIQNIHTE